MLFPGGSIDPPWRLGQDWCLEVGLLEEAGEHTGPYNNGSIDPLL